jgi:methionyl-tRNA synthetase
MNPYYNIMGAPWFIGMSFLWVVLLAWSMVWKGLALYRAGRREDKVWFVVLLIVNTLGILEILYLYVFGKDKAKTASVQNTPPSAPPAV